MATLTLLCQDGEIKHYNRDVLRDTFQVINDYLSDFPNVDEVSLDVKVADIHQLLNLHQHLPSNDREWLNLFDVAQYLGCCNTLLDNIHQAFVNYFVNVIAKESW